MLKRSYLFLILMMVITFSCRDRMRNEQSVIFQTQEPVIDSVSTTTSPKDQNTERAIWQKPSLVIDKLGDISKATIADIGAGEGYFAFRLANSAAKVLAIDIERSAIKTIDSVRQTLPKNISSKVETRLAKADDPLLLPGEVDIVVIINTIAYIQDFPTYLKKIKKALKPGGRVMVIDYKKKRLPINAPPKSERVYLDKVEDMMIDGGLELTISDDTTLDYQYILVATMP
jgi:2-polyprenyl-3-methyl-5-hydroxy-6-metoxy-1,4-benzoquinol methylase